MDIEERLQKLYKIRDNLRTYEYGDLEFMLNELVPSLPVSVIDFKNDSPEKVAHDSLNYRTLYRARPHSDIHSSVSFPKLAEISYIGEEDLHKIEQFGRVNKPEQSIFYCCTEIHTACMEGLSKGINIDELYQVSEKWTTVGLWKLKEDLKLAEILPLPKILSKLRGDVPGINISDHDIECAQTYFDQTKTKINNEEKLKMLEFFSEEFLKTRIDSHKDYMISNYYADRIMNRIDGFDVKPVDGIIFPSVPSGFKFKNLALEPEVVDAKLEFLGAKKVQYVRFPNGDFVLDIKQGSLGVKADENGIIQWKVL